MRCLCGIYCYASTSGRHLKKHDNGRGKQAARHLFLCRTGDAGAGGSSLSCHIPI